VEGVEKPRNEEGNTQESEMRLVKLKGLLHLLHAWDRVWVKQQQLKGHNKRV